MKLSHGALQKMPILLALYLSLFSFSIGAQSISKYDRGELIGLLGGTADLLDLYSEVCYSKGTPFTNNVAGIDVLLMNKWGTAYSSIMLREGKLSGRDYREENRAIILNAKRKLGGCQSPKMKNYYKILQNAHEKYLDKFHSSQ